MVREVMEQFEERRGRLLELTAGGERFDPAHRPELFEGKAGELLASPTGDMYGNGALANLAEIWGQGRCGCAERA